MVTRMVESLRRHGGRFADAPVWAITPRYGPRLAPQTLKRFAELRVEHHTIREGGDYDWYNLWNKIASMKYVEARAKTDYVAFIDSDILVTGEPTALIAGDFTARVHSFKHIATTGPHDPKERFWAEACQIANINIDDLPWVETFQDRQRIRLYFNSGVFSYRRDSNFAQQWSKTCMSILDARIAEAESKSFFIEQTSLGLALIRSGLSWEELPVSHNYDVASWDVDRWQEERNNDKDVFAEAVMLHYHDAMKSHFWSQFLELLEESHSQAYSWLSSLPPVVDPAPTIAQVLSKSLKIKRVLQRDSFHSQCQLL